MGLKLKRTKQHGGIGRLIHAGDRTMTFVADAPRGKRGGTTLPSMEEIEAALEQVPEELSWEWASRRLIPIFERGYGEGIDGDPMINTVTPLGVGIGFGIDFGPVFGRVTRSMALRWEASVEQLHRAAFAHLADTVATVTGADLQTVVHRGHLFRALGTPAGWASSVVLAGEAELVRIFGVGSATFTAPCRSSLIAFGPATPAHAVEEVTWALESMDPNPLGLQPFELTDGVLRWTGLDEGGLAEVH